MMRKPKLGQNFLIDDEARNAIVDALGALGERTVIEIGPGHGAITAILAARCRRLIAIEVDPALAAELRFRFREQPQVEVLEADVLKGDFAALVAQGESADVVRQSAILHHLADPAAALRRGNARAAGAGRGDDAAGGCEPVERRSGLSRVRAALRHHANERPRGDAVHAAAHGLLAAETRLHISMRSRT